MAKPKGKDQNPDELTESEWAVMKVVWECGPCAAGTVQEALASSKGWAYSTVKTIMDRMVKKEMLASSNIRYLQLFSAKVSQAEAQKGEFRKMLSRAFNGALTPMMQFLVDSEEFGKDDLRQLRQMVKDSKD